MSRIRRARVPRPGLHALAVLLLSISGCIQSETTEIVAERVDKPDGWTITYTFDGLYSDSEDERIQQTDFSDIVKAWKGNADVDPDKHTMIDRSVWLSKDGRLMGRMKTRVRKAQDLFDTSEWIIDSLGYHLPVDGPDTIVASNGAIEHRGSRVIVTWPPRSRRFELKTKTTSTSPRGDLVPYYQAYVESTSTSK
jgi:hypothetical protein